MPPKTKSSKSSPQADTDLAQMAVDVLEIDAGRDDPEFYQTDPDLVEDDLVVNLLPRGALLPRSDQHHSSIWLKQGDRVKGSYFRQMVTVHRVEGLALCRNVSKERLEELERIRQERDGNKVNELVKDCWSKLSDENTREIMKGRR